MRYAARPAKATERLSQLPGGRIVYRLKRPWRDGTTDVIFEREDFIAKLAALTPAPRVHLDALPRRAWTSRQMAAPDNSACRCDFQHNVAKAATFWFKGLRSIYGLKFVTPVQPEPDRLHKLSEFIARPDRGAELRPRLVGDRPE